MIYTYYIYIYIIYSVYIWFKRLHPLHFPGQMKQRFAPNRLSECPLKVRTEGQTKPLRGCSFLQWSHMSPKCGGWGRWWSWSQGPWDQTAMWSLIASIINLLWTAPIYIYICIICNIYIYNLFIFIIHTYILLLLILLLLLYMSYYIKSYYHYITFYHVILQHIILYNVISYYTILDYIMYNIYMYIYIYIFHYTSCIFELFTHLQS